MDKDYLGEDIIKLYKLSKELVGQIDSGEFEWDTYATDTLLNDIRDTIGRVDI